MKFTLLLIVIGFMLIAGTAGAHDLDPTMPTWQVLAQSIPGLIMFYWGVDRAIRSEENKL